MAEVKLMIDGRQIVADASKTVLEAALDNGITVLSSKHTVYELCAAIHETETRGA